jgi:hypothetical protein
MITQLFSLTALVFARGIEHKVIYHIEVVDGGKIVVNQDATVLENHSPQFRFVLNYRELLIKLKPSQVDSQQIENECKISCNSSILDSTGLIVGEHDMISQTATICRLGVTQVFDVGDKFVEFVQTPKDHKLAKDHLLVSISYKKALDGPYFDAPVSKPAPEAQP